MGNKLLTLADIKSELHAIQKELPSCFGYTDIEPFLSTTKFTYELKYSRKWTNSFGFCIYNKTNNTFKLVFNGWALSVLNTEKWKDTVRHEYAHMIHMIGIKNNVFPRESSHHCLIWKAIAKSIHADPYSESKSCPVGVLGRVININFIEKNVSYGITYKKYLKLKPRLQNKKNITVEIARKEQILDLTLLKTLDTIIL